MTNELSNFGDQAQMTIQSKVDVPQCMGIEGWYHIVCRDKDGNIKWEEEFPNLVLAPGKQLMLDTLMKGSSYSVTGPYLGLTKGTFTYAATDTLLTSTNGTGGAGVGTSTYEFTNYTSTPSSTAVRGTASFASSTSTGATPANITSSTASAVTYTITGAGGTVSGCFLVLGTGASSTFNNTAGVLYSEGSFSTAKTVTSGDTVSVTYSTTATS